MIATSKEGMKRYKKYLHNASFRKQIHDGKIKTSKQDEQEQDLEEEEKLKAELPLQLHLEREHMGFDATGSVSRQLDALTLASVRNFQTPHAV